MTTQNTASKWMRDYWRPAMAIQYIFICVFDFFLAPVLWTFVHIYISQEVKMWEPLTLNSGGLYHMAMGAVLGVAAYTRGREKTERIRHYGYPRERTDEYQIEDDYGDPVRRTNRYDNQ